MVMKTRSTRLSALSAKEGEGEDKVQSEKKVEEKERKKDKTEENEEKEDEVQREEDGDKQASIPGDEEGITQEPKAKKPRHLTAEKCRGKVMLFCPWGCGWVKPVPNEFNPLRLVAHVQGGQEDVMYVDYYTKSPPPGMKQDNCYKKTLQHIWKCCLRGKRTREDFGPFFNKTYGSKPTKAPERFDSTERPRTAGRAKRMVTVDRCKGGETILKCPGCEHARRWPEEQSEMLTEMTVQELESGVKVIGLDQSPTKEMRKHFSWKKMRQHCIGHGVEMPKLYCRD
jgi:hypothetical protein